MADSLRGVGKEKAFFCLTETSSMHSQQNVFSSVKVKSDAAVKTTLLWLMRIISLHKQKIHF